MSIQGVQLIYRLQTTIRLLIDYRSNVDLFNLYYSNNIVGPYAVLGSVKNIASKTPSIKGKIQFEFNTNLLVNWDNNTTNYIKIAEVINNIEGVLEGPIEIPTRLVKIQPKEFSVIFGLDYENQKFVPISVDSTGKIKI